MSYNICSDFRFWCQKVLPLVYDESLSYYEVLCKLTEYIVKMFETQESFQESLDKLGLRQEQVEQDFSTLKETVTEQLNQMQNLLNDIRDGKYADLYIDSLQAYIDQNLQNMVKGIVSYVSFGLTANGYFAAYIPPSWDFLGFDTVPYGEELAGHLILRW